jgi:hypothetical protein
MTPPMIEAKEVIRYPLSRQAAGFPQEGDRGNAILLLADECGSDVALAELRKKRHTHAGLVLYFCDEQIYTLLDQLRVLWCPWPERGFTFAIGGPRVQATLRILMVDRREEIHGNTCP